MAFVFDLAVVVGIEAAGRGVAAGFRRALLGAAATASACRRERGALPPVKEKHHASVKDAKAIDALLRAIDGYQGSLITKCALYLAPLLFVRPGELRKAEWTEFNFDGAE